ncbi:hypothetical protein [Flavobacterium chungangensis]|uniref:Lipoprotein n=1 Tax=Flavobacterium chungangensis TaxID=2708132 RepID=A0ABV8Z905_9FLAO
MKKIIGILFLLVCFSCDPMDDRMSFMNNSNSNVHVRMLFLDQDEISETMVGLREVKNNEIQIIGILYNWESEFKKRKSDTLLKVIVYKDFKFLKDKYEQSSLIKSDSLLGVGEYEYRSYSYKDLERRNWKINYPKDGFEKGLPLFDVSVLGHDHPAGASVPLVKAKRIDKE